MDSVKKYGYLFGKVLFFLFVALVLFFTVRGLPGNPTPSELNTSYWITNGPFELSNERGRYALLYSFVENHTLHFQPALAKFSTPDVSYLNHQYVSIFAPSISFIAIPGYLIGRYFQNAQFGTYLWMSLFAFLNVLLIRAIAIRMGAKPLAASIAGLTFLFATPAFAYAVTMYEHHVSTFLILLCLYLLIRYDTLLSLITIWILYAFAFTVDYPNLFLMFPIAVATFLKSYAVEEFHKKLSINISFTRLFSVIAVIIPLLYFMWFNQSSYDNPFRISGTVARVIDVKGNGAPIFWDSVPQSKTKQTSEQKQSGTQSSALPPPSVFTFFNPRNMMNGLYILLLSPDRGIFVYTQVIILGAVGMYFALKKKQKYMWVVLSVAGMNLILYSMWGDPYGGWAFGSRYLIPSYAMMAVAIGLLLTYFVRNRLFVIFFLLIFSYSVLVNTLGAITSNNNPPKIEAEGIAALTHKDVEYTYMRNLNDLNENNAKSYMFQTHAGNFISAWQYYGYIAIFILIVSTFIILVLPISAKRSRLKE